MDNEVTQTGADTGAQRVGRRHLLGAGLGGAALSLLPFLSGQASASATTDSTTEGTTGDSTAASTTTTPPKRPTADDTALLAAAQQAELAAYELYGQGIAAVTAWTEAEAAVLATFREAHLEYAHSLSGLLGREASNTAAEAVISQFKNDFGGDKEAVLAGAWELESALVATHGELLGLLQGLDGAGIAASIQIAEARHCTVLADLAGSTDYAELLVDKEAEPLQVNG